MSSPKVSPYSPGECSEHLLVEQGEDEDQSLCSFVSDTEKLSLHQGARFCDKVALMNLIRRLGRKKEKIINSHDKEKLSPLHYAAKSNSLEVVKLLVENGADVDNKGEDDDTPLHYAAKCRQHKRKTDARASNGHTAIDDEEETNAVIDFLISQRKSADGFEDPGPNLPNKYGQVPLHFAAMRGNTTVARSLLSRDNIDIEIEDKQGLTPLHVACIYNQHTIANMLIDAGADLYCLTNERSTPLHLACAEGHSLIVELLLRKAGPEAKRMIDAPDDDDYTPIHYATDNGHYKITKMCLEKGGDVNARTDCNATPLHLAASAGDVQTVRMLLKYNAIVDALTDDQATPLHWGAMYNHGEVIKALLADRQHSKNLIHKKDADGYTPFLLAAVYGHTEALETLYNHNPNVMNATEKNDKNAIHLAAEDNRTSALEFLLSKKEFGRSAARTGDRYACEPMHLAAKKGCVEAVKILLAHDAGTGKNEWEQTPLHLAAINGWKEIVRLIVEKYRRAINDDDENTNSPLHLAALNGQHETAELLIELGADVTCRNSSQWTPLDCAASNGWVKTARVLLENDAPVDCMDKASTTPLHLAAQHGHASIVNELLKAGADVSNRTDNGRNALDLAIEYCNRDCAAAIINSDDWKDALRNQQVRYYKKGKGYPKTCIRDTPMRKLIRTMPDVAEMVFNKCMKRIKQNHDKKNGKFSDDDDTPPPDDTFEVEFLFEFLEDEYSNWDDSEEIESPYDKTGNLRADAERYDDDAETLEKNHCLYIMVSSGQESLLAHPLVLSFLNYKWYHLLVFVYAAHITVYMVFLGLLTAFVFTAHPPYMDRKCPENQKTFPEAGRIIIGTLSGFHIMLEVLQMYLGKLSYMLSLRNLMEWVLYICSILLVINFTGSEDEIGYPESWQWRVGAVAEFFAWINLLMIIQKIPTFGIYVVMFTDILKTFVQFFIIFALFIIAFAFAFHLLLQNQEPFATVHESLIKTLVMMIGEMDYGDIFYGDPHPKYEIISCILFFVFIIIMPILIMNLLVGLAVDDIKAVQEKAELKRIAMQVDLSVSVNRLLPEWVKRRFVKKSLKMDLNTGWKTPLKKCFEVAGMPSLTPEAVTNALNPDINDTKKLQKAQDKLQRKMEKRLQEISNKIDDLQSLNEKVDKILAGLNKTNATPSDATSSLQHDEESED